MTIDEAIKHAREVAEENRKQEALENQCELFWNAQKCRRCAREHEQLAEWLEELKIYKSDEFAKDLQKLAYQQGYDKAENDYFKNTQIDRESSYKIGYEVGYSKAIGGLLEVANEMAIEVDTGTYFMKAVGIELLEQIAEQLKAGGTE